MWKRLKTTLVGREQARERAEEEAAFHLEMREQELRERGYGPEEAARVARASYGNVLRMQEEASDTDLVGWLEGWLRDGRVAARRLVRSPLFLVSSAILMAVGLGVNAGVFSVMDTLFLRALPFADARRLVVVEEWRQGRLANSNPERMRDWQQRVNAFASVGSNYGEALQLREKDGNRGVSVMRVAGDWIGLLGVEMLEGRRFRPEEFAGGKVAVLTARGRGIAKVGSTIRLGAESFEVIGVAPQQVALDEETEVLVPLSAGMWTGSRKAGYLSVVARLKPGVSMGAAEAELTSVAAQLAREYPETDRDMRVRLVDAQTAWTAEARKPALYAQVAAGLLLMITLLNLAGLLAARALERSREDQVRLFLGAGKWHLVRLHLSEAGLVVGLGLLGALGLAPATLMVIQAQYGAEMPQVMLARIDGRVLALLLATGVLSLIGFAGVMAWQASRADQGRRGGQFGLRNALLVGEAAVGVVLLAVGLQLVQDFSQLRFAPLGIREQGLVSARTYFSWNTDGDELRRVIDQARQEIGALPGVTAVAVVDRLPLEGGSQDSPVLVQGEAEKTRETVGIRMATRNYFAVMGIPLLTGVVDADENAVLVNETFARLYLKGAAVGRSVSTDGKKWWRVAGVVGDVRYSSRDLQPRAEVFFHERAQYWPMLTFVLKTSQPVENLAQPLRQMFTRLAPDADFRGVATVEGRLDEIVSRPRRHRDVVGVFGVVALLLVLAGVYGVMASEMLRRRKEMGIRVAVGATRASLLWTVLRRTAGMGLVAAGLGAVAVLGLLDAWIGTAAVLSACLVVVSGMVAAGVGPAWRAAQADPLEALRCE